MKIAKANPFLKSPQAKAALWVSAKTSSAIEGIRLPFAEKGRAASFPTTQALIDHGLPGSVDSIPCRRRPA